MNAVRTRILVLLIVSGLLAPAMQVAGHSCRGDACWSHSRQADPSCDEAAADSCCATEETESEDDGCCSGGGCDCMCCGATVITLAVRPVPAQVTIAPRSVPVALPRLVLRPQDAVGTLLRPPQA